MRWHLLPRITYSRSQLRQTPAVELSQMQLMRASGLKSTAYAHNDPSEKIFQPPFHPTGSALDGLIQMKDSYHDMPLCGPFIEKQHTAMTRAATTQKVPAAWIHLLRQSHISKTTRLADNLNVMHRVITLQQSLHRRNFLSLRKFTPRKAFRSIVGTVDAG